MKFLNCIRSLSPSLLFHGHFAKRSAVSLLGLLALASLTAHAQIRVTARIPVSVKRVSQGEFDVTYRLLVKNMGAAATDVTAVATSYTPEATIVQGNLTFPNVLAGGVAISKNTYTLLQDGSKPIDQSLIRFAFSAISTPVANAGPDQMITVLESDPLISSGPLYCCMLNAGQSYDPFGQQLSYSWSVVSAPSGSTATVEGIDSSSGASYPPIVVGWFIPDLPGDYELKLVVNNGYNNSAPSYIHLSTVAVAPSANAGYNQTIKVNQTVQLDGTHSVNPMNRPLTYAWSFVSWPLGRHPSLSDPASPRPTFRATRAGDYKLQLVVTDGALSSAPATVTYSTIYTPAHADAGPDMHVTENSYGFLSANRSTDVDGRFLTYRWVVLNQNYQWVDLGHTFSNPQLNLDPVPNPDFQIQGGPYHIELFVNDGISESIATQVLSYEDIHPSSPPINYETILPAIATVDPPTTPGTFTLDGTLSQSSEVIDGASWNLREAPSGSTAQLTPSSNGMTAAITPDVDGLYIAQFQTESWLYKGYPTAVSFLTHGGPPVANPGPTQFGLWTAAALHTLNGSGSWDPDGYALTYRWSMLYKPVGSNAVLSSTTAVSPTFTADVNGTYIFQLIVNNGVADSAPATVSIISKDSAPPIDEDLSVAYPWRSPCIPVTLHGSDPLLDPYYYGAQLTSLPSNGFLAEFSGGGDAFPPGVTGFPPANYGDWGLNGTPADNPEGQIGADTICYIPFSLTWTGFDSFTYRVWDQGYPSGCFTPGNYCIAPKYGTGTVTISVYED